MNKKLRMLFLVSAAIILTPINGLMAFEWFASGDALNIHGYATTGGNYVDGDRIFEAPGTENSSFQAVDGDDTLNISSMLWNGDTPVEPCSLKIDGDVILDATTHDMTVNVLPDNETDYETVIYPYMDDYAVPGGTEELGYSQVVFLTALDTKITVNLQQDLVFSGSGEPSTPRDMIVTFKGPGQTVFKMYDGTALKFDGQIDYNGGIFITDAEGTTEWYGVSESAAGKTRVYVTMDQLQSEVDAGNHKVLFERANDEFDPTARVMVYVGHNSFITYLSDNVTGIAGEGTERGGFASIGFDPSNVSTGRMVLFLKGAYWTGWEVGLAEDDPLYWYITEKYPMNDAAVVVAGHYIDSFDAAAISHHGEDYLGVDFSTPAGIDARLEVIDNQYYDAAEKPVVFNAADSRGLLVVNDVQNHGKLASDPYWDFYDYDPESPTDYYGPFWTYTTNYDLQDEPLHALDLNVRRGFVVGINGRLNVYDNAFLDYTAGSINQPDAIAFYGTPDRKDATVWTPDFASNVLKKRNPSALIIDGMDESLFYGDAPICVYSAGNPFLNNPYYNEGADARHGEINLYGHARAYFKNSASSYDPYYGYIYNFWNLEAFIPDYSPIDDINIDWNSALLVGEPNDQSVVEKSTYDGFQLSPNAHTIQFGEGNHVLDVEGKLSASSFLNTDIYASSRSYADAVREGTIAMSSVLKDYTGREVNGDPLVPFERPLLNDGTTYWRYNSPGFFFNDHAQFWNTILRHDEATKYVNCLPWDAEPAYTGGERLFFSFDQWPDLLGDISAQTQAPDRYRLPEIRFYNSFFEFHESACATGMRFTVKDIPGVNTTDGSNTSYFRWYDHGDILDTLLTKHGRVFQLSSMNNLMADDVTSNYATESAPFNVYKGNQPLATPGSSSTVYLSLQRDYELPDGAVIPTQVGHNLFLVSQPDAEGASCYMKIGWEPNIFGEGSVPAGMEGVPVAEQGGYPYEVLPGNQERMFALNALDANDPAPHAVVSVDGNLITFGSFNKDGVSPLAPVTDYRNNGIIYILHGGKMQVTRPDTKLTPFDRNSVPYQACFDTIATKNIWNDWNLEGTARVCWFSGIFDMPHDQVAWGSEGSLKGYGLQPFGLTTDMFNYRTYDVEGNTDGYVRLDFNNDLRTRADKTGDEEVLFGWFQRDAIPALSVTKNGTLVRTISPTSRFTSELKSFLTRATESIGTPVDRPEYLLYVSAPDDVTQMRVSGATMADPFELDVAGNYDEAGLPKVARVREFTTQKTTNGIVTQHFIGEGQHAVLFGEYGGIIGLGDRHWNEFSPLAWNLLGKDFVTIAPLGDMTVALNSNLIIADRLPLIATTKFAEFKSERLTFYSALPLEIRVPAGFELDLSSFGQSDFRQEIEFAGNVRLVLEDGASIRFPDPSVVNGGVVLYFNDDSQMIFEGVELPGRYVTPADTNFDLIKIIGKGQIWLNKNAKMLVNGDVQVGVVSDILTPNTDVTISIQRQAAMYIGDSNLSGGMFQVGNPVAVEGGNVDFKLAINGPQAKLQIDREGFFGLGAGMLNRVPGNLMNGNAGIDENPTIDPNTGMAVINPDGFPSFQPDTTNAWQVVRLYDANNITIELTQGAIQHSNIFDGSSGSASLWAIGPANSYTLSQDNSAGAIIRGGGNLMYIPTEPLLVGSTYHSVNIWNYAGNLVNGEAYSILGSGSITLSETPNVGSVTPFNKGRTVEFTQIPGGDTPAQLFFDFVSFVPFRDQSIHQVCISKTLFDIMIGFVNWDLQEVLYPSSMTRIVRKVAAGSVNGNLPQALNFGAIDGRADSAFSDPTIYTANWPVQ